MQNYLVKKFNKCIFIALTHGKDQENVELVVKLFLQEILK